MPRTNPVAWLNVLLMILIALELDRWISYRAGSHWARPLSYKAVAVNSLRHDRWI